MTRPAIALSEPANNITSYTPTHFVSTCPPDNFSDCDTPLSDVGTPFPFLSLTVRRAWYKLCQNELQALRNLMSSTQTVIIPTPAAAPTGWSSVAKKVLMAVTGTAFILFVIGHMLGNLGLFLGQEHLNQYAAFLQSLKKVYGLLWVIRLFLLSFLIMHVWTGIRLWLQNRSARPIGYAREDTAQASISSRIMIWTGLGMFSYVVYHLLHFTFIVTNPGYNSLYDAAGRHDVYSMVILGFQNYLISGVYILAMFVLALHLNHALPSLFQTLGLTRPAYRTPFKRIGNLFALLIFCGYVSMPVAVLAGIITLPGGGH